MTDIKKSFSGVLGRRFELKAGEIHALVGETALVNRHSSRS